MTTDVTFSTGAVLSVLTGRLVSENHMTGIYAVLEHMTWGEGVYTHQIPRISREAGLVILKRHPHLQAAIDEAEQVTPDNWREWLATWKDRYGDEIVVPRFNEDEHERINPLSELVEKVHPDRIVVIGAEHAD